MGAFHFVHKKSGGGKSFRFDIEADDEEAALEKAVALAERLLSNPVIEDASARIVEL